MKSLNCLHFLASDQIAEVALPQEYSQFSSFTNEIIPCHLKFFDY